MTKTETDESLDRVLANHAYAKDNDLQTYTYSTEEVGHLISTMQSYESMLVCVKEDLKDLRLWVESKNKDKTTLEMIESTLAFIG